MTKGRVQQKLRTRMEILSAAKLLMRQKKKVTLEDIAHKAKISRATMYRYYSSIDLLFTEASLDIHHKSSEQLINEVTNMDFEDRILYIQNQYNQLALKNEVLFRRYLSSVLSESITSKKRLRGARRVKTMEMALSPFKSKLAPDTYRKLIHASSVLMGIDPVLACKDVCALNDKDSEETLRWAMKMMLKGIAADGFSALQ